MFPVKIVLGLASLLQLAVTQDYHGIHTGQFGAPVAGLNTGNFIVGAPGSSNLPEVFFDQGGLPGVPSSGVVGTAFDSFGNGFGNAFDAFPGMPAAGPVAVLSAGDPASPADQVTSGVLTSPVTSGNTFQANPAVSVQSAGVPVFTGQSGQGVFSLPTQQGGTFLSGQGGSFVGSQVLGQPGATGQGVAAGVPVQGGVQAGGAQVAGFGFASSVLQQQVNPTVTQTVTVDAFETLTDLVLHSAPVTVTQFSLITTTRVTRVIVPTPVNDVLALSTSVVLSPTHVTLTETKSDFRVVVRTSVRHETLTHTVYAITHVPFTTTVTERVRVTSPIVSTRIVTSVEAVTRYNTVTDTAYVHGGYGGY